MNRIERKTLKKFLMKEKCIRYDMIMFLLKLYPFIKNIFSIEIDVFAKCYPQMFLKLLRRIGVVIDIFDFASQVTQNNEICIDT